ncbi:MAG: DHHA1 domain-containing protein [Patescibacteria group bacterium]|nr:DHHA1 domain-containing protein [Patescibacteria group bacterium]
MKKIVVLYHSDCRDGFSAAWVAWKKFKNKADYVPIEARVLPKKPLKGKEIYVLDNSFPASTLKRLIKNNLSLMVIDHHKSSEKDVKSIPSHVFDLNHSGAVLSWKYFHPKKPVPKFLRYVEDADIWRFREPFTKEISTRLNLEEFTFTRWTHLANLLETAAKRKKYAEEGKLLLRYKHMLIDRLVAKANDVVFEKIKTKAVNSPLFRSEVGHILAKKHGPIGIIWRQSKEKINVSLRSNGKVDVSKLAAKYGGGGHKAAAAFTLGINSKLPWRYLKPKTKNRK